ncbi:NAD kinase [Frankliniella fusca]|uniref:NAD kinase n=1 Tax=Frankliniella fusca TaxID=407009 RepID=A0AAE1HKP3_9NEOP|nr:NAD kinase [Frankliniella fusca]
MFYYLTAKKDKTCRQCAHIVALALRKKWVTDANTSTISVKNIINKILAVNTAYNNLRKVPDKSRGVTFTNRAKVFMEEMRQVFNISSKHANTPTSSVKKEAARADPLTTAAGLDIRRRRKRQQNVKIEDVEETNCADVADPDFECDGREVSITIKTETESELPSAAPAPIGDSSQLLRYLDKGGSSTRNAFRAVASVASAVGVPVKRQKCSHTTLWRKRVSDRVARAREIREEFKKTKGVVKTVHYDGIKVEPLVSGVRRKLEERLPVVVTGQDVNQLLAARVISSSSGEHTAAEVVRAIRDWDCADDIVAQCSDTPTGNTGYNIGAGVRIEAALGKKLLFFACWHHILDLIPQGLFDRMVEKSTSPDIGVL